jgi:ornithine carbamoyltransferase
LDFIFAVPPPGPVLRSPPALRLGASIIQYGPNDLQLATGESSEDTGRILAQYLDAMVVRTNGSDEEMRGLAQQGLMCVINAMSETEHPTQVIGDLISIKERTGDLQGRTVAYFGEGNNTAAALAFAVALTPGMCIHFFTPKG